MEKGHTKKTPKSKKQMKPSRDTLIKTTRKGDVELTEDELRRASGGGKHVKVQT